MRHGAQRYRQVSAASSSPRQTEIAIFTLVIKALEESQDLDATPQARIKALGHTHDFWSLLVRDLAREGNQLPDSLKNQLISLGFWAMRYCTRAILQDLPLKPLIDVCQNIAAGLQAQKPPPARLLPDSLAPRQA